MLRALALLNSCADGCTEALMLAHGITEQAPAGLTPAQVDRVLAGGQRPERADRNKRANVSSSPAPRSDAAQ